MFADEHTVGPRLSVEELGSSLEDVLDRVRDGQHFVITLDGEPAAIIMKHPEAPVAAWGPHTGGV